MRCGRTGEPVDGVRKGRLAVRFAFERIVVVGMPAAQPKPNGRRVKGGHEQRAPALELGDMYKLVLTPTAEFAAIAGPNHMSERHGGHAADTGDSDDVEQSCNRAPVKLPDALLFVDPRSAQCHARVADRQCRQGNRRGPEIE